MLALYLRATLLAVNLLPKPVLVVHQHFAIFHVKKINGKQSEYVQGTAKGTCTI
jgi:hypothetical protein